MFSCTNSLYCSAGHNEVVAFFLQRIHRSVALDSELTVTGWIHRSRLIKAWHDVHNSNYRNDNKPYTLLHRLCELGDLEMVKLLHKSYWDVDIPAFHKRDLVTPLHQAVLSQNIELVRYLLDNGADPDVTQVCSPLSTAIALEYVYL